MMPFTAPLLNTYSFTLLAAPIANSLLPLDTFLARLPHAISFTILEYRYSRHTPQHTRA